MSRTSALTPPGSDPKPLQYQRREAVRHYIAELIRDKQPLKSPSVCTVAIFYFNPVRRDQKKKIGSQPVQELAADCARWQKFARRVSILAPFKSARKRARFKQGDLG